MNIFVLDEYPGDAARYLCDKHVVKMILESTQILSTVSTERGFPGPYKITHANHPCTKWIASNPANWAWLMYHAITMCEEYSQRYSKIHKCQKLIYDLEENSPKIWAGTKFENHSDYWAAHTPFVQCMPDQYKKPNAVDAYRAYYIGAKKDIAKWSYSEKPSWF